jgi:hypothetical protein
VNGIARIERGPEHRKIGPIEEAREAIVLTVVRGATDPTGAPEAARPIAVRAAIDRIEALGAAEIARVLRIAPDRPTAPPAGAGAHRVETAIAREWAERTIPPGRWMDRSHCRSDV